MPSSGPLINTTLLDWYSGTPPYTVTPRAGIERVAAARSGRREDRVRRPGSATWARPRSKAARTRDAVVVCVGNHPEGNGSWALVSSPSEGKEAVDRKAIVLQPEQEEFIKKLYAVNPNTVVVLISNFPYAMPWAAENASTIVHLTHASQEQGNALGDVLFGNTNPGGKTVQTWPKSLEQLPPMMDYDIRHGHTYMYFRGEPQYPFGYGLSYTTFALSNLAVSKPAIGLKDEVVVSVDVANTGDAGRRRGRAGLRAVHRLDRLSARQRSSSASSA